jgi:hypothetical protein
MKKLFFLFAAFLSIWQAHAQVRMGDFSLLLGRGDSVKVPILLPISGGLLSNRTMWGHDLAYGKVDSMIMLRDSVFEINSGRSIFRWVRGGGSGSGTKDTAIWGKLIGNINDQADLITKFNTKQNTITTGTALQYLKGNLTLGTFNSDVLTAIATGSFTLPLRYSAGTWSIDRATPSTNGYTAASDFTNFQTAFNKRVTDFAISGSSTKTIMLTFGDLSTLSRTFTDNVASGTSGVVSINNDTSHLHFLVPGTSGTDFTISDTGSGYHIFNFPTAGLSVSRGLLATADFSTFAGKQNQIQVKHSVQRFNGDSLKLIGDTAGRNNFIYRMNSRGVKEWDNNSYDSLLNKPSLSNYKKDSVLLYSFDPLTQTPTSMGWTKGSNYVSTATESSVSDGLQIVSTSNTFTNNFVYSGWKSMASDVTASATMRIVSWGSTLAVAGIYFGGTTALLPHPGNAFINLITNQVFLFTYEYGQASVGTLINPVSAGDIIRLSVRRNFAIYTITVYNITKNTTETFTRDETTDPLNNGVAVNQWNPGILVMNATVVYRDFKFFATTGYHADYLIVGASIQQNQWKVAYDSSLVGRLNASSNKIVALSAGAGMNDQDIYDMLPEIYKLKPKTVIWGDVAWNDVVVSGQSSATWLPLVKRIGDSLMNHGIRLVIERNPPANNTGPAIINAVIDSAFSNDKRYKILDGYKCFPAVGQLLCQ